MASPQHGPDNLGAYTPLPQNDNTGPLTQDDNTGERKPRRQQTIDTHPWQQYWIEFLEGNYFQTLTVFIIMLNAVCVGLETDMPGKIWWEQLEAVFLVFFTCELFMRMVAFREYFFDCFENQDFIWNMIDLIIVSAGLFSTVVVRLAPSASSLSKGAGGGGATVFRTVRLLRILRILRVVRVFRFLKQLYLLAYGFVEGANAVFWVATLAACVIYVCAIVLVRVYREEENGFIQDRFGSIPTTMFTLFEIMSDPSLEKYREEMFDYPLLVAFLVVFIIFGSFGINGLLTGVISESILEKNQVRIEAMRMDREVKRRNLMKDCGELFDRMDEDEVGSLQPADILEFEHEIRQLFQHSGVVIADYDLGRMLDVMDYDSDGYIEKTEFCHGILELCEEIRPMSIMELNSAVARCDNKISQCSSNLELVLGGFEDLARDLHDRHSEVARARELMKEVSRVLESQGEQVQGGTQERLQKAESVIDNLKNVIFDFSKSVLADAAAEVNVEAAQARKHGRRRKSAGKKIGGSSRGSPRGSPRGSHRGSPRGSPRSSPKATAWNSPRQSQRAVDAAKRPSRSAACPNDIQDVQLQQAAKERADELLKKVSEMQMPRNASAVQVPSAQSQIGGASGSQAVVNETSKPECWREDEAAGDKPISRGLSREKAEDEKIPSTLSTGRAGRQQCSCMFTR